MDVSEWRNNIEGQAGPNNQSFYNMVLVFKQMPQEDFISKEQVAFLVLTGKARLFFRKKGSIVDVFLLSLEWLYSRCLCNWCLRPLSTGSSRPSKAPPVWLQTHLATCVAEN